MDKYLQLYIISLYKYRYNIYYLHCEA